MGKAERNRQSSARAKIAEQQAAASRAEGRRRAMIAGGGVLIVGVIVVVMVAVNLLGKPAAAKPGKDVEAVTDTAVAQQVTSVPASVLDAVGAGPAGKAHQVAPLSPLTGQVPLTQGGKPEVLYIGAEYCPYCAAERWAVVVALSRFGTWSNLRFIHSTSQDVYSNTATMTFYGAKYTSQYLTFVSAETQTVSGAPLQSLTSAQSSLLSQLTGGSFPFVDIGGKYAAMGAQFYPDSLGTLPTQDPTHFGLSWTQIAGALQNPKSLVSQQILGAANHITAAICQVTNGQPGAVCGSGGVKAVGGSI